MAKLEAMLEQRGIASPREMSEAVARCQLHGGDLTTSLLQFVSADEAKLSATLSECYELPAAVVGVLPPPGEATLRAVPRELLERYCCFPLEASPGRLALAVARPLEAELKEELGFALGVQIEERVALEVRIRQAMSRYYGLPLSARNQRGIARLEGDLDASPQETPAGLWPEPLLSALPRPPSERPPAHDSVRPSSMPPSSGARPQRRRGPLSLSSAREELARASTRQDVLDTFFGFACQFFEYSALFAVHNSLAEGLNAWGPGADHEAVQGIGVPLDLPSSLSEAAESCKTRLVRLGDDGLDRTLSADLRRPSNARALILPVCLRRRCAVLLYADNGPSDVVEREIADVVALAPDVANALARIILQRKRANSLAPVDSAELSASLVPPATPAAARPSAKAPRVRTQAEARPVTAPPASGVGQPDARGELVDIPNKNRDKSRSNARTGSKPNASPAPIREERERPIPSQRWVNIEPAAATSEAAPEPDVRELERHEASAEPVSGEREAGEHERPSSEDPVFLLARPPAKRSHTPPPPDPILNNAPRPSDVAKPPVAITRPARTSTSRPRLPSVIIDPSAVETTQDRGAAAARAAAITRAPSQSRQPSVVQRRAAVPPPADAPRMPSAPPEPTTAPPRVAPPPAAAPARKLEENLGGPLTGSAPIVIGPATKKGPPKLSKTARPSTPPLPAGALATGKPRPSLSRAVRPLGSATSQARSSTSKVPPKHPGAVSRPPAIPPAATVPATAGVSRTAVTAPAPIAAPVPLASRATAAAATATAPPSGAVPSAVVTTVAPAPKSGTAAPAASSGAPPGAPSTAAADSTRPAVAPSVLLPPPPPAEEELQGLIEQLCQGNSKAVQDVARIGSPTLPLLMERFPGPVISERAGPSSRASECGPLLQALAAIGPAATPNITRSSEAQDPRVRRWATLLLGELPGPEACRAVVQRLADDVPRVHQAALDAAQLLLSSPAANLFRKTLFEVAETEDAPLTLRLRTLEHVAKLRDSASVPRLITFLGTDTEPIVHKALWALSVVTRQDFGRDSQSWWDWWRTHQNRHRIEWLIDALDHRDPRLRKAAAEELQVETRDSFGYAENLPARERLEARERYRRWWATVGAPRFGR